MQEPQIDMVDPWEKERHEKRRKTMRWVLGSRPRPGSVFLFGIPGILLVAGARIGVAIAGAEPTWFEIPRITSLGVALMVAGIVQGLRVWGHEGLKYIRWGRDASEIRN